MTCFYYGITETATERLTPVQKHRFQEAIADLASAAVEAVKTDDEEQSSKLWRNQFGDRFFLLEKQKQASQRQSAVNGLVAFCSTGNSPKPWGYR